MPASRRVRSSLPSPVGIGSKKWRDQPVCPPSAPGKLLTGFQNEGAARSSPLAQRAASPSAWSHRRGENHRRPSPTRESQYAGSERTQRIRTQVSADVVMQSPGGEKDCIHLLSRFSGTAYETLASSAARAVSPAVRRSCAGRLMSAPKFSIAGCPAKCSGRRSTKQTQALRHSRCEAGGSSLPSSQKREEARATHQKDESPIECVWNTFTHERLPFKRTAAYDFITQIWGNFWASRCAAHQRYC
jgi:hypothetical protein